MLMEIITLKAVMENNLPIGVHNPFQRPIKMVGKITFSLVQILIQKTDTFLKPKIISGRNQLIEVSQSSHREP